MIGKFSEILNEAKDYNAFIFNHPLEKGKCALIPNHSFKVDSLWMISYCNLSTGHIGSSGIDDAGLGSIDEGLKQGLSVKILKKFKY
jgi:hypothetical protein